MKCPKCKFYSVCKGRLNETVKNCVRFKSVEQTNEEWFCGLDTRLKAEAIFVFMDSVSKQINGEPITNKEEIIDNVIMRWLKEKHDE